MPDNETAVVEDILQSDDVFALSAELWQVREELKFLRERELRLETRVIEVMESEGSTEARNDDWRVSLEAPGKEYIWDHEQLERSLASFGVAPEEYVTKTPKVDVKVATTSVFSWARKRGFRAVEAVEACVTVLPKGRSKVKVEEND